jgi:hypothetical protein
LTNTQNGRSLLSLVRGNTIMKICSIDYRFCATVYIKADTLADAASKFQLLEGNTINALDKHWFSDAPFDSDWMPELSLATAFTSYGPSEGAVVSSMSESEFRRAMKADATGNKSVVLPSIDVDGFRGHGMNVYWCDVEMVSRVFSAAEKASDVASKRSNVPDGGVDLEYTRTWLYPEALDYSYFPYAISPKFRIVRAWEGWELELRWPETQTGSLSLVA